LKTTGASKREINDNLGIAKTTAKNETVRTEMTEIKMEVRAEETAEIEATTVGTAGGTKTRDKENIRLNDGKGKGDEMGKADEENRGNRDNDGRNSATGDGEGKQRKSIRRREQRERQECWE
jgi:hypothetical protein